MYSEKATKIINIMNFKDREYVLHRIQIQVKKFCKLDESSIHTSPS